MLKDKIKTSRMIIKFYNKFLGQNKFKISKTNEFIGLDASVIKKTKIRVYGKNNKIRIAPNCHLNGCKISIYGDNSNLDIGENNLLKDAILHLEDSKSKIIIGCNNLFTGKIHIASIEGKSVVIGNGCMFSSNIDIRNGDSHSIIDLNNNRRINYGRDIIIGNNVWCGHSSIILKGTKICNNSIIAAGAIITKEYTDENIIIGGNPSYIIKSNVDWDYNRI